MLHYHYSVSALTSSLSTLMAFSTLLFVLRNIDKSPSARESSFLGMLSMLSFMSHYNLFWLPAVCFVYVVAKAAKSRAPKIIMIRSVVSYLLTVAIIICFVEGLYRTAAALGAGMGRVSERPGYVLLTYLQQLFVQATWGGYNQSYRGFDLLYYPSIIMKYEGGAFLGLAVIALVFVVLSTRSLVHRCFYASIWIAAPLVIWTIFGYPAPRNIATIVPVVCMSIGWFVDSIMNRSQSPIIRMMFAATMCGIVAFITIQKAEAMCRLGMGTSPYKNASSKILRHMERHNDALIAGSELSYTTRLIYRRYLGSAIDDKLELGSVVVIDNGTFSKRRLMEKVSARLSSLEVLASERMGLAEEMIMEDAWLPYAMSIYEKDVTHRTLTVFVAKAQ